MRKRGKCWDQCYHDKVILAQLGKKNPYGSWKLQQLKKKMDAIITHFPKCWREVTEEDAGLYYPFLEFCELAAKEGRDFQVRIGDFREDRWV